MQNRNKGIPLTGPHVVQGSPHPDPTLSFLMKQVSILRLGRGCESSHRHLSSSTTPWISSIYQVFSCVLGTPYHTLLSCMSILSILRQWLTGEKKNFFNYVLNPFGVFQKVQYFSSFISKWFILNFEELRTFGHLKCSFCYEMATCYWRNSLILRLEPAKYLNKHSLEWNQIYLTISW